MTKRPSLHGAMRKLREDTKPNPDALVFKAAPQPAPIAEAVPAAKPAKHAKDADIGKDEAVTKPAAARSRSTPAERYAGMKKMLIPIEEGVHRRLKALAAEEGKTLEKTVQDACAAYLGQARER